MALAVHSKYCNSEFEFFTWPQRVAGGYYMIGKSALASTRNGSTTDARLWRGVIARTIQDWLAAPLRPKRAAERYLFENSDDLSQVCGSAGIDVGKMRQCLNKVRGRKLEDILPFAA
jgi:hypothetical protein